MKKIAFCLLPLFLRSLKEGTLKSKKKSKGKVKRPRLKVAFPGLARCMATATPAELLFLHLPAKFCSAERRSMKSAVKEKPPRGQRLKLLKPALLKSSLAPYPAAAVALSCNLAFHLSSHTATMEP